MIILYIDGSTKRMSKKKKIKQEKIVKMSVKPKE